MDYSLKKQLKSVSKGIITFDIVVLVLLFILDVLLKVKLEGKLFSNILSFDIASVLGLLIGSVVSEFNFYTLTVATETLVSNKADKMVGLKFAGGYILRFGLYAVVLFIGAKLESVSMFTAALGLLSVQIVLLLQKIFNIFRRKEV